MNQYHCGTCKHTQMNDKGMLPDCEKTLHWLTAGDRTLTKEVGCVSHGDFQSDGEKVLDRLDKEIHIREDEMNRRAGLEENLVIMSGYYASAGALNWVRKVLIDGSRETIRQAGSP